MDLAWFRRRVLIKRLDEDERGCNFVKVRTNTNWKLRSDTSFSGEIGKSWICYVILYFDDK